MPMACRGQAVAAEYALGHSLSGGFSSQVAMSSSERSSLVGRCIEGQIGIAEIMPTIDRTVYWLTTGYEAAQREGRGQDS